MTVDRGGLRYQISVEDDFSNTLTRFRSQVARARQEFNRLSDDSRRQRQTGRDRSPQERELRSELAASRRAERQRQRQEREALRQARAALQLRRNSERAEQQRALAASRQAAQIARERQRAERIAARESERSVRAQQRAVLQRIKDGERYRRELQRQIALERRRRAEAAGALGGGGGGGGGRGRGRETLAASGAIPPIRPQVARSFQNLTSTITAGNVAGSRFLFTFRRLFGVLAAFTVAREAAAGIQSLVATMVRFNAEIEQAELGIATLLTATGVIRDANGNVRRSAEALNLAQGEARRQLRLLRIEGLRTAATFEQLAETFQVGLAPGLAAGLDVDQVRRFTVQISQAASAVGLQQNQLAEEIRSILSGTIQVRTTRLAVALGITNEDIRQARNAGRLFQFLQTRFQTFSIAGARAARTFNAALVNTQDALAQLLGAGGVELFEQLRQLFLDISETAVTIPDDLSEIRLNPSVVQALRRVGDALGFSVEQARLLVRELSAGDFDATLALTGQSIRDAAVFLRQAFLGAVRGANDLATIVLAVRDAIQRIAGTELFEGVDVETIARLGTIVGGIAVAFLTASGAVGLIASAIGTVASVLAVPVALAGAFTAALVASVTAVQRIVESFTGVRVSIGAALNLITQGIAAAVAAGEASFRGLWASFRLLAFDAYTAVRNGVLNPLLAVIRGALISASFFGSDSAERALQDLNRSQANLNRNLEEERALRAGIKKDLDNTVADIDVILAKLRNAGNDALANPEQTLVEGLRAALNSPLVQDVVQGITGLFSRLADGAAEGLGFKDASSAVTELISRIETLRQQLLEPLQLRFAEGDDAGFVSADRTRSAVGRFIDAWRQGAKEVANELEKTIPSGIEAAVEVLNGVITRFASFVSDLIIDAFDPSNDQTIQQRIGQFLQGIARLVLNTLAQIAIQTAIANIVGALGGNISLPLAIGSGAEGGIVRPGGGPFSFADGTARVPNRPAPFRPRGIPRSDTVNAWLTPGEAVIRRDSARKYGYEVMEALNRGLMDPTAMQAMARRAGGSRSRSRLSRGPGYAAGGVVRSGGRSQSGAQQPAVVGAILEANEQTMERLLAGGRQSMLDFMRRNSAALAPGGR